MRHLFFLLTIILTSCASAPSKDEVNFKGSLYLQDTFGSPIMRINATLPRIGPRSFFFDTGSTYTKIPTHVVHELIQNKELIDTGILVTVAYGNGMTASNVKVYSMTSLRIGTCTLRNVLVAEGTGGPMYLLGADTIQRLKPVLLDTQHIHFAGCKAPQTTTRKLIIPIVE